MFVTVSTYNVVTLGVACPMGLPRDWMSRSVLGIVSREKLMNTRERRSLWLPLSAMQSIVKRKILG